MNQLGKRPLALIIIDGWGVSPEREGNAVAAAHTPFYDDICAHYPSTTLAASGLYIGQREGEPGNAEIGHRTIGAGRVVETEAGRIQKAVATGEFLKCEVLRTAFARSVRDRSSVHFVGLLSDGGVHASQETLFALLRMAKLSGVQEAFVHCILDGRDVRPRSADIYVDALEIKMADIGIGKIASLCGRFYAMDASENWERTARAYTMLVHGEGERSFDAVTAVRASFLRGISDEFIAPIVIEKRLDEPLATISENDLVVFFNHTAEPMRQLVRSLAVPDASSATPRIEAVCLVEYDSSFGLPVAFGPEHSKNVLAALFDEREIRNYRITESARAPHVTGFFNGRGNSAGESERRVVLPTPGPEALAAGPESRSFKIADNVRRGFDLDDSGVFIVNFPAPALLAETGIFESTIEAVQYVDTCLGGVIEKLLQANGVALITSSHGGCEQFIDPQRIRAGDGRVPNAVPFHFIDRGNAGIRLADGGSLQDIAPTLLGVLGIEKPFEMTGRDLRLSR